MAELYSRVENGSEDLNLIWIRIGRDLWKSDGAMARLKRDHTPTNILFRS